MRAKLLLFLAVAFLTAQHLQAVPQEIGSILSPLEPMWVKSENGLIIAWHRGISNDANSSAIRIFDKQGNSLVSLDILRLVPEAQSVSISDVSARPQQLVAVAAVYARGEEVPPAAVLLYLDFKGALLSAAALEPAREIAALAVDDKLNTWTLTWGSAGKDPSQTPLVVEYDKTGESVREVLTRNLFPPHEQSLQESPLVGSAVAGYSSGVFWFWLPKSTDLVTIRTADGALLSRTQLGYPQVEQAAVVPLQIASDSSGAVIAEVRVEEKGPKPTARLAYFAWSPETKSWTAFDPYSCHHHRLVGTDGNQQIYFSFDNTSSICSYSAK